ncbi:MAG: YfiM family protein [Cyclobacteriaceae bacterium]|nr:YfiM family protein [Cyclobacteriaceae bacterium]
MKSKIARFVFSLIILLVPLVSAVGQVEDSTEVKKDSLDKKKLRRFVIVTGTGYTASMVLLNHLWYKDFPRSKFHFFNDNHEWLQMDKVGHSFTAFHLSHRIERQLSFAGVPHNKSTLYGSLSGFLLMVPIEWFDGYSTAYGASSGDLIANFLGSSLFYVNSRFNEKIPLNLKFSFIQGDLAPLRPEVLGKTYTEQLLKNYNAQAYWLTLGLKEIVPIKNFPDWLHLGLGYGAEGMIYARDDVNTANGYTMYRQFYLGLDIDLSHFKTKSALLNNLLYVFNTIHIPAPAIEFSQKRINYQWFR